MHGKQDTPQYLFTLSLIDRRIVVFCSNDINSAPHNDYVLYQKEGFKNLDASVLLYFGSFQL